MTPERLAARRHRLLESLEGAELDALLVTKMANIRYLTGFSGSAAVVLVTTRDTTLFSDFRYREQAAAEVGAAVRTEIVERSVWDRVIRVLGEGGERRAVGFEAHAMTVKEHGRLAERNAGRFVFRPVADLVERLRARKDAQEVAAIRAAARVAGEALTAVLQVVRVGQRETEIAGLLEAELRKRGSERHPFPTIVASGPRTALPHAGTTGRPVGVGEWLLLDFGAQIDGYCADITRTVVVGRRADERQRAVYDLVREAQCRGREHVRAGMTGREADALARSVIEARGFADAFGHSLGHGIGLEVHEGPRLSRSNEEPLPEGAVVTVEPGVYLPGWGGVRIEDDVRVSAAGTELLSDGATELRELT